MPRLLLRLLDPTRWPFALALALLILEIVLIWIVSGTRGETVGRLAPGPSGNLLHVPAGGALAICLLRLLAGRRPPGGRAPWPGLRTGRGALVMGLVLLHGLTDEIHQFFVPGRTTSVADLFLDLGGAAVVLAWPWPSHPSRPRRPWLGLGLLLAALLLGIVAAGRSLPGDRGLALLLEALFGAGPS